MKAALGLLTAAIALPAAAMQDPKPGKGSDPHVCDVNYNANETTNITSVMGREVTIQFSSKDHIQGVTVSDSADMRFLVLPREGGNFLSLKAVAPMEAQPIFVIATTDDNGQRPYTLQWTALSDRPPSANVAGPGAPPDLPQPCYTIRYQYPNEERAAQVAKWNAAAARQRAQQAEIALHQNAEVKPLHTVYVGQGDQILAPTRIFDDGNTTQIEFGAGRKVPTILTVTYEGKESEIAGITTLDNGVVQIHGTLPLIRLRDGDLVLCMFNQGYSQNPSTDPQTGTTSPAITREPYVK